MSNASSFRLCFLDFLEMLLSLRCANEVLAALHWASPLFRSAFISILRWWACVISDGARKLCKQSCRLFVMFVRNSPSSCCGCISGEVNSKYGSFIGVPSSAMSHASVLCHVPELVPIGLIHTCACTRFHRLRTVGLNECTGTICSTRSTSTSPRY